MNIGKVILGSIAVLLLASFMPDIISSFNTAEETTGAATGLSTGLNVAQIALGIAAAIVILDMAGINIVGNITGRSSGRRRR